MLDSSEFSFDLNEIPRKTQYINEFQRRSMENSQALDNISFQKSIITSTSKPKIMPRKPLSVVSQSERNVPSQDRKTNTKHVSFANDAKSELKQLKEKNDILVHDLEVNCGLLKSMKTKLENSTQEVKRKSEEIIELRKQLRQHINDTSSNELEEENQELKKQLSELQEKFKEKESQCESQKELIIDLKNQLEAKESIDNSNKEASSTKDAKHKDSDQQINILISKNQELEKQVKSLNEQLEQKSKTTTDLNNQVDELAAMCVELEKQNKSMKKQAQTQLEVCNTNSSSQELIEENKSLRQKNKALQENVTKLEGMASKLMQEYTEVLDNQHLNPLEITGIISHEKTRNKSDLEQSIANIQKEDKTFFDMITNYQQKRRYQIEKLKTDIDC